MWNADVSLFNVYLLLPKVLLEPAEPLAVGAIKHRANPSLLFYTDNVHIFLTLGLSLP